MNPLLSVILGILISPEGFVAAAMVGVVAIRFYVTVKSGVLDLNNSSVRQVWLMWCVYFCLAAASVFHLIDKRIGGNSTSLSWVVATTLAVLAFILLSAICVEISPLRPHWNWPTLVGVLTIGFMWWATIWQPTLFNSHGLIVSHFAFATYLLSVIMWLTVPAFYWSYKHETQTPMKVRFALMVITNLAIAAWMVNSLIENTAVLIGWSYNQDPVYYAALVIAAPAFAFSYLMPASYFVKFIVVVNYCADVATLVMIRHLENQIATFTHVNSIPRSIQEWLQTPSATIYRSAIAIFDARKQLAQTDSPIAQTLASDIEHIARPDLPYPFVISRLRRISIVTLLQGWTLLIRRPTIRA